MINETSHLFLGYGLNFQEFVCVVQKDFRNIFIVNDKHLRSLRYLIFQSEILDHSNYAAKVVKDARLIDLQ